MPTIQKASCTMQAKGLAVKRLHMERSLCLKAFHFSSFSLTSLFISQANGADCRVQTGGHSMAEAG